ncbi:methylthioribose kinase [Cytobacillus sp. S13-E01]|uniref:DUF7147 family protein n=1 Tax=Cytobacillus sp. S13-E01 TaxID=3031326 RepID=UPI0023D7F7E1|nr:methylthioribose kinase [Cytobacillus sp. S13-E01]MDF0725305.1 methylthioribose kinase [Cytobacillus sp. S13-E01]
MIQRFIELGEGYSDIYELLELSRANKERLSKLFVFKTKFAGRDLSSFAIALQPTNPGKFQALYICREGIPNNEETPNKRSELFRELADELDKNIISLEVKHSSVFGEKELYFQHLIGILRMNKYIPPMQ